MSSLTNLTQAQRTELRYIDPIQLLHITLPSGLILYFSEIDYKYTYGSTNVYYDSYVSKITGLSNVVEVDAGIQNPNVRIELFNKAWSDYSNLILLNSDDEFTRADIAVYEIRPITIDETFTTDQRVCIWKGNIKQIESVDLSIITLACCSRLHNRKNAFGLETIEAETFPKSDPNDRGKYRNKIYGDIDKVKARCIKTGAIDKLSSRIGRISTTSLSISGITKIPFTATGQVQVDEEIISYTGVTYSGTRPIALTGLTRGAGSTDPYNVTAVHESGAYVGQVLTEFLYEVADHPVYSIDKVFVDDIRTTSYTGYTGQTGSVLAGHENTAVVRFTVEPYVGQQINVDVDDHDHNTVTGSHAHSGSGGGTASGIRGTGSSSSSIPSYDGGVIYDASNAWDGNTATYAYVSAKNAYGFGEARINVPFTITIPADNRLSSFNMNYWASTGSGGTYFRVTCNGQTQERYGIFPYGKYTFSVIDTSLGPGTYTVWTQMALTGTDDGLYTTVEFGEITLSYTYSTTSTGYSPATGVETSKVGATALTGGTSTSTIVIGNEVTVDVKGYMDDSLGTYTGTANSLIENPSDIFKHMLCNLNGFSITDDIDSTTFASARSFYTTNSYEAAFPIHDIGTEVDKIVTDLAYQFRSQIWEWGGKFYLVQLPSSTVTSNLTIYDEDIEEYPSYSFTNLDDLKNKLRCFYLRDYRDSGGSSLEGVLNSDAMAEGYLDVLIDSIGDGDLEDDLHLKAIRSSTTAQAILTFWLNYKSTVKMSVNDLKLRWKAIQIGPGQYFTYDDPMFGSKIYRITRYSPDRASGLITISGIEAS